MVFFFQKFIFSMKNSQQKSSTSHTTTTGAKGQKAGGRHPKGGGGGGKPPRPPPKSNKTNSNNNTNKRKRSSQHDAGTTTTHYHSHELDGQTTILGIVSQSPLGPRWTEEECTAFFNGLKEEKEGVEKKKSEHVPNFEVIAAKTGRSVKECVNMYDKNQAFLSLPDGVASATALHALTRDYFDSLEKAAKEKAARNKSAREWSTSREDTSDGNGGKSSQKGNAAAFIAGATSGNSTKPSPKRTPKKGKRTPRENKLPSLPLEAQKLTGKEKKDAQLAARNLVSLSPKPSGKRASPSMSTGNMMTYPAQFGTENKRKLIDNGGFESDEEYQDTSPLVKQTQESQKYTGEEENVDGAIARNNSNEQKINDSHQEEDPFADVGGALDGLMTLADAATPLKKFNAKSPRKVSSKIDRKKKANSTEDGSQQGGKNIVSPGRKKMKLEGQKSEEDSRLDAMLAFGKQKIEQAVAEKYKTRRSRSLKGGLFLLERRAKLAKQAGYTFAFSPPQPLPPPGIPCDHPLAEMAARSGNERTRKWALAEWFMPGMDKDWFARNDFKRFVKHCNVDENSWSKQPRKKWRDVRKALGKVRRLSIPFLRDERIRLEYHRNAARAKVEANLKGQTLNKEEIEKLAAPNDTAELIPIPEPFIVGQRVLAKHPSAKRAYVGSVLTVSKLNVRVQFDDPQLGSEQIKDIDVMGLGAEYDEALRVLSENAAIGDALERDEDRKMGLIFSKAKRRVSGMEKGLELAFMGKQFSLEDGVLSRENYGQVVLPDVKKEEPLSQATVEQMPIPPAEQRTPTRSSTRGGGGGGGGGDNAAQTTPTRLRRGAKPKDEQTDDNNGFANIAASQELSQHPPVYAYDETRRRAEEKKFRELIEKIRTSHKKKDNDALQTALRNFRDEFGYERGVYEGDLIGNAPINIKTGLEPAAKNEEKKTPAVANNVNETAFLDDLVEDTFLVATDTASRSVKLASQLRDVFSETLKPKKKTSTGFASKLLSESTKSERENAQNLAQTGCEMWRALRAFCDSGYEHSSLARAITERALEVVKNKDKENDELYEQLHTQVKRFATIASVVKL